MRGLFRRKDERGRTGTEGAGKGSGSSSAAAVTAAAEDVDGSRKDAEVSLASLVNGDQVGGGGSQHQQNSSSSVAQTQQYGFHSLALQVKDANRSLHFYRDVLGMRSVKQVDGDGYTMYFLAFGDGTGVNDATNDGGQPGMAFGQHRGLLQLIHVHGSESDPAFKVNVAGPGFAHFSVAVSDVEQARDRMAAMGVKVLEDGCNAQGFAAVADPDGYSVQLIANTEGEHDGLRDELSRIMSVSSLVGQRPPIGGGAAGRISVSDPIGDVINRQLALQAARGGSPVSPGSPA